VNYNGGEKEVGRRAGGHVGHERSPQAFSYMKVECLQGVMLVITRGTLAK